MQFLNARMLAALCCCCGERTGEETCLDQSAASSLEYVCAGMIVRLQGAEGID